MKVAFALLGSRGDVQPGVVLATALAAQGHRVTVAVPANLVDAVGRTGLPTRTLAPDTGELLGSPLVTSRLKSRNPVVRMRALREIGAYGAAMSEEVMLELADDADLLVPGLLAQERAATIAESRGIRLIPLHYCPVRPNRVVNPLPRPLYPAARSAAWHAVDQAYWYSVRAGDRALRRRLGLPYARRPLGHRLRRDGIKEIQLYDGAFFPGLAEEWGSQRPFTGAVVPEQQTLDALNGAGPDATADALAWVQADRPPVYVGFGSMPVDADRFRGILTHLTARGHRVIAHTAAALTPHSRVLAVSVPLDHDRLLPACHGAVHHGGAGTTAASARAGLPTVVGWLSADQPIWARAIAEYGAGSGVRLAKMCASDLSPLDDPSCRRAATTLARNLVPPAEATARACRALLGS